MSNLTIKIVGIEGENVLVKYVSENSAKPIDEYEAVSYQPKAMGYNSFNEFIEGIKPNLASLVESRDKAEQSTLNLDAWVNYKATYDIQPTPAVVAIPEPLPSQAINNMPEVIL